MSEFAKNCTRVYLLSSTKAHLLAPGQSPRDVVGRALCGLSTWPTHWRGASDYGERQQAADMALCANCERKLGEWEAGRYGEY